MIYAVIEHQVEYDSQCTVKHLIVGKIGITTSAFGETISYTWGEWSKVFRYIENSHLTPDINSAERAIRPFVLGRKN